LRTGKEDPKVTSGVSDGEHPGVGGIVFEVRITGQFGGKRLRRKAVAVVVHVPANGGTAVTEEHSAKVGVVAQLRSLHKTPETIAQPNHRLFRPGMIDPDQVSFVVVVDVPSQEGP
jgi:hypothetical protein